MKALPYVVVVAVASMIVAPPAVAHDREVRGAAPMLSPPYPAGLPSIRLAMGMEGREPEGPAFTAAATPGVDPKTCGAGALPETGLQGQVPAADKASGREAEGYRCGLELIGQNDIQNRGGNFQMNWLGDCAYVGMSGQAAQTPATPTEEDHPLKGVAVIDASNPRAPKLVRILKSPVGQFEHEAIEINRRRRMLVVQIGGVEAQWVEVYDASDCRNPVFKGRYDSGGPQLHGMAIAPDGKTVYATNTFPDPRRATMFALDVSDMAKPRLIRTWDPTEESPPNAYGIHDLEVDPTGNRIYAGAAQRLGGLTPGLPSLTILDVSEVQRRAPNPDIGVVSETVAANFGHTIRQGSVDGRPFIFLGGELPFVGANNCPWAWGHAIDISDERNPSVVSDIKLEVNELANCAQTGPDDDNYSIHFNGVDSETDTTLVLYAWYGSGLRAFDVRDPAKPREIAYYNPPTNPGTVFDDAPGSEARPDEQIPRTAFGSTTPSQVRYRAESGEIWFTSVENGFQIAKLTPEAQRAFSGCLARRSPIGARSIGRVRLGQTRVGLLARVKPQPVRRDAERGTFAWCAKRSRGEVTAVFDRRGRARLVATSAAGHGNRGLRPGGSARRLRNVYPRARSVARGVLRLAPHSTRLVGVRRGRVRYFAVADRRLLARPRALRRYLQRARLDGIFRRL